MIALEVGDVTRFATAEAGREAADTAVAACEDKLEAYAARVYAEEAESH